MQKNLLINVLLICLLCSCSNKFDNYLNKGLFELQNKRIVNQFLIENFKLETFGVIKSYKKVNSYNLVFLLNRDVTKEVIENYSVTIRVVPTEAEKLKNHISKPELFWNFKPELMEKNGHKYMIYTVTTKLKKIKEFRFALYHREGYKGETLSRVITIRNMIL